MKAIVDLCVVPLGVGVSVSEYVAACERILTVIKLGTRVDRDQTMDDKVRSVQTKLG